MAKRFVKWLFNKIDSRPNIGSGRYPGKWFKNIIAVVILAFLVWYLSKHGDRLKVLLKMSPVDVVLLYLLTAMGTINNSRVTQILIGRFNSAPHLPEMVALQNATRLLNYVPMKFGTVFRAAYLKRRYGMAYTHYVAVVTYLVLLTALTAGLIGLGALLAGYGLGRYEDKLLAALFACLFGGAALFMVAPLPRVEGEGFLGRLFKRFFSARGIIQQNPKITVLCFGHLLLTFLLTSIRLWIIYRSLGHDVCASGYLVLGAVGYGSAIMGLTPGALGVRELLLGASSVILGVPLEVGIAAAMFDRAIMLSWTFVVGGGCTVWFWHKSPSDFKKAQEVGVQG